MILLLNGCRGLIIHPADVVHHGLLAPYKLGLDRTGHMSFLTGQDRTPKFAGQVLPDRTESGLIFSNILPYKETKKLRKKIGKKIKKKLRLGAQSVTL